MNNHNKINDQLLDIAYKLSSSLELQFILDKITEERTLSLLSTKRATIYLLDSNKEFLEPVATLNPAKEAQVMSQKLAVKSSLSGKVVKSEKGMIFNNPSQYSDAYHIPGTSDDEDENLMVLPLMFEKEILGTLNLYRKRELFLKEDVEFARIFAMYAGAAIQNGLKHQNLIREIEERKHAEGALKESEEKFQKLFKSNPIPSYTWKRIGDDFVLLDYNNLAEVITEGKIVDIVGISANEMYKEDKQVIKDFEQCFRQKSSIKRELYYQLKTTGKNKYLNVWYTFVSPDLVMVLTEDITEHKQMEKKLLDNEEKFSKIFQTSPNVITISNIEDGTMLDINDIGIKALGYKKDEIIGRSSLDLGLVKPENRDKLKNLIRKDGYYSNVEFPVKLKSGALRIGLFYGQIIEISDKQYLFQTIVDITDRKTSELKLNNAYEEIKELKDKFQAENIYLRKTVEPSNLHKDIVGTSPQINDVIAKALQVAPMDSNVLLLGETGTGKELITRGIHDASKRKDKTLVTVNCAAIPDSLIESELFGHEKGAFTDAQTKKIGLFEIANKSTLFLDEIGDLPYNAQSKLLRVLENEEVLRVGSNQPQKVDVRIIAATNQDLLSLIKDKKFRQDLYYRLNVFPIELPPLRTRKQDIKLLVEKFVEDFNNHMGRKVSNIPKKTLKALEKYSWPGNVRELRNVVERSMITSTGSTLKFDLSHFTQPIETEITTLEDVERSYIQQVLESTYWKIAGNGGAAEILGLKPNTLRSRMEKLGISRT